MVEASLEAAEEAVAAAAGKKVALIPFTFYKKSSKSKNKQSFIWYFTQKCISLERKNTKT